MQQHHRQPGAERIQDGRNGTRGRRVHGRSVQLVKGTAGSCSAAGLMSIPAWTSTHADPWACTAQTSTYSVAGAGGAAPVEPRVKHRHQLPLRAAAQILHGLRLLTGRDAAAARRPGTAIHLAVLRLKLGPADHAFRGIEPESPFGLGRRSHLVKLREVAALVGRPIRPEMQNEERLPAWQIEPMQQDRPDRRRVPPPRC